VFFNTQLNKLLCRLYVLKEIVSTPRTGVTKTIVRTVPKISACYHELIVRSGLIVGTHISHKVRKSEEFPQQNQRIKEKHCKNGMAAQN
jgi:hypothetical protein